MKMQGWAWGVAVSLVLSIIIWLIILNSGFTQTGQMSTSFLGAWSNGLCNYYVTNNTLLDYLEILIISGFISSLAGGYIARNIRSCIIVGVIIGLIYHFGAFLGTQEVAFCSSYHPPIPTYQTSVVILMTFVSDFGLVIITILGSLAGWGIFSKMQKTIK